MSASSPLAARVVAPPVSTKPKPTRTIEDVRADLARLRAAARERQARLEGARDTSFEPTDFMDFVPDGVLGIQSQPSRPAVAAFPEFDMLKGAQRR